MGADFLLSLPSPLCFAWFVLVGVRWGQSMDAKYQLCIIHIINPCVVWNGWLKCLRKTTKGPPDLLLLYTVLSERISMATCILFTDLLHLNEFDGWYPRGNDNTKGSFAKTDITVHIYLSKIMFLCIHRNISQTRAGLFW